MRVDPIRGWYGHNGVLLNATIAGWHVHLWMWGARCRRCRPEHRRLFRLWRLGPVTW